MKLLNKDLLKKSADPEKLSLLIELAEKAYKTFQPTCSEFLSAPILKEIITAIEPLNDIKCIDYGGFVGCERKRVLFIREFDFESHQKTLPEITGLEIAGNFLFDRTTPNEFLNELKKTGLSSDEIGDIWLIGDRGAQLVCTPEAGKYLDKQKGTIRSVNISYEIRSLSQLRLPVKKIPRKFNTIEASLRLDAIASGGFGISRSKIVSQIKAGKIRINWVKVNSASKLINEGDQIQLEAKGTLKVLSVDITKKDRWRIELLRE